MLATHHGAHRFGDPAQFRAAEAGPKVRNTHSSGIGRTPPSLGRRQVASADSPRERVKPMTCSGGQYAIETFDLTRRFGDRIAVDQLSLQARQGGIYGFLGPNGAGKTTTMRMLLGLIRPDAGRVQIFGEDFDRKALGRIGSLVEMPSLYPHLSGRENLEVTRRLIGAPPARVDRALAIMRLSDDARRLVREYSLGMKQRLGLALTLLNNPDLLILDEPTNGLDPAGIHEMRDLLRRMPGEHGVTIFVSSHLLSEVEQIADFVGIIHRGRMVFQGPLTELRSLRKSRLRIGVDGRDAALQLLRSSGFDAGDDGNFILLSVAANEAGKINRLLLDNAHDVFHLSVDEESVEHIFLSLTGETAA
jgi:ABC-type multidrug transport system ATPase subunit